MNKQELITWMSNELEQLQSLEGVLRNSDERLFIQIELVGRIGKSEVRILESSRIGKSEFRILEASKLVNGADLSIYRPKKNDPSYRQLERGHKKWAK